MALVLGCGGAPVDRTLVVTADNSAKVWVNETSRGEIQDWRQPLRIELTPKERKVVIAVEAINLGGPGGVIAALLEPESEHGAAWVCSHQQADGWQRPDFDDSDWEKPKTIAVYGQGPWADQAALGLKEAEWVWPSDPAQPGETVYCRARF